MKRRVVITGIGSVTATGNSASGLWKAALTGLSCVRNLNGRLSESLPVRIGAAIQHFDPCDYMDSKSARRLDLSGKYALAAGSMAVTDSELEDFSESERTTVAVIDGSALGALAMALDQHAALISGVRHQAGPMMLVCGMTGTSSAALARRFGFRGQALTVSHGSVSSACAIGMAFRAIVHDETDIVISGGTEAPFHDCIVGPFARAGVLSRQNDQPARACKPFAVGRDGIVLGEGAAYLVLEEYEHARRRDAKIYCEVVGFAENNDAYHPTSPDPNAVMLTRAIGQALGEGSVSPESVGYVNLHGTGTPHNDRVEALAVKNVFGERSRQPISGSTKPITGHLIGASGAVEAIITALALQNGIAPPSVNNLPLDPECNINCSERMTELPNIEFALSVNLSFGGRNTALLFRRL